MRSITGREVRNKKYKINTKLVRRKMFMMGYIEKDLAIPLFMTKQNVGQIINGKHGTSMKNLELIARLLDLQVDDFVEVL